jgi:hypothetical protein
VTVAVNVSVPPGVAEAFFGDIATSIVSGAALLRLLQPPTDSPAAVTNAIPAIPGKRVMCRSAAA